MNGVINTANGSVTVRIGDDGKLYVTFPEQGKDPSWWMGGMLYRTEPARSVTAEKGKGVTIVLETGRIVELTTAKGYAVNRIVCTSNTIGEYEATGLWAGN